MVRRAWDPGYTGAALEKAKAAHASLGYDFAATESRIQNTNSTTTVSLKITNRGVAPFYYNWPVEFSILDANGTAAATQKVDANLPSLLPGQTTELTTTLPTAEGTVDSADPQRHARRRPHQIRQHHTRHHPTPATSP